MRRMLVCLLICMLPLGALAAPDTPYAAAAVPRYGQLTETRQGLLDMLYAAALAGETRIDLPQGTRYDDAAAAVDLLLLDFPELAGLDRRYTIGYWRHAPETATYVELGYTVTGAALAELRSALLTQARAMANRVGGTAFDRALSLHDSLCMLTTYDLSAPHAHDAYGALVDGRAACEGYAQAMTLLCRMAGIPCGVVTGKAWDGQYMQDHAWNFLYLGGVWCQLDATWDDQSIMTHWYFGLTEEQMGADHQADNLPALPHGEGVEYHRALGLEANNLTEAEQLLRQGIPAGGASIRFVRESDYTAFLEDVGGMIDRYNRQAAEPFYGTYSVMTSPAQRCVLVYFD